MVEKGVNYKLDEAFESGTPLEIALLLAERLESNFDCAGDICNMVSERTNLDLSKQSAIYRALFTQTRFIIGNVRGLTATERLRERIAIQSDSTPAQGQSETAVPLGGISDVPFRAMANSFLDAIRTDQNYKPEELLAVMDDNIRRQITKGHSNYHSLENAQVPLYRGILLSIALRLSKEEKAEARKEAEKSSPLREVQDRARSYLLRMITQQNEPNDSDVAEGKKILTALRRPN